MPIALVTGSGGLIGSEAAHGLIDAGWEVVGIENDMRRQFFGDGASTAHTTHELAGRDGFRLASIDIRDGDGVAGIVRDISRDLELIIHAAAQPSHDWAAGQPHVDFGINATGTLNLLEAARHHAPTASFVFMSTNKVYGDHPNRLPLEDRGLRLELPEEHRWHQGIDTSMSIDDCMHSLFGVSKAAADLMVQEYGRYFDMPTVCFRCGCLTGPRHAGARQHGFLSYLMRAATTGDTYTIYGYAGKQVRDNLHSRDVLSAALAYHSDPKPAAVYNLGGGRDSNCSVLEAIEVCEDITGRPFAYEVDDQARTGDHRWWISDVAAFQADYPGWSVTADVPAILREIHEFNAELWQPVRAA
jgi:CDP-paratose 2-epimerase